jgi:hypothetical protein
MSSKNKQKNKFVAQGLEQQKRALELENATSSMTQGRAEVLFREAAKDGHIQLINGNYHCTSDGDSAELLAAMLFLIEDGQFGLVQ